GVDGVGEARRVGVEQDDVDGGVGDDVAHRGEARGDLVAQLFVFDDEQDVRHGVNLPGVQGIGADADEGDMTKIDLPPLPMNLSSLLKEIEAAYIDAALAQTAGNRQAA